MVKKGKDVKKNKPVVINSVGKRPLLISVLCIIAFVGVGFSVIMDLAYLIFKDWFMQSPEFAAALASIPTWYQVFGYLLLVLDLIFLIYVWQMKKWALWAYTALIFVSFIASYYVEPASAILGLVSGAIYRGLFFIKYKEFK